LYPLALRELLRLRLLRKEWLLQAGGGFLMRVRQQVRELCGASLHHGDSQTLSDGKMYAFLQIHGRMQTSHACMHACLDVRADTSKHT
jgi:hypothetical protein